MSYTSFADLALRMLAQKGRLVTYTRPGEGVDPITQAGAGASTTYALHTLAVPLSSTKASLVFGPGAASANKRRASVTCAMRGAKQTPQIGDRFTWGGVPMRIATDPELLDPDGSGAPISATFLAEAG